MMAAADGQEQAFDDELPDDAGAAGAEGRADGDLLLPGGGAGQQQVGHVGAGDEKHEADQPLQDDEWLFEAFAEERLPAHGGDEREGLLQEAVLHVGELGEHGALEFFFLHLAVEDADGGLGLLLRDARLEPTVEVEPGVAFVVEGVPGGGDGGLHHHRDPDVGGQAGVSAFKARGGYADDLEWRSVEADVFADDVGAGSEAVAPEVVLEDDDGMSVAVFVISGSEQAAELRAYAEDLEVVAGDEADTDHLAAVFADEAGALHSDAGEAAEDGVAVAEFQVLGVGEGVTAVAALRAEAAAFQAELHEFARVFDGQHAQQDLVHQGEHGGVGADAEGQGEDGDGGEDRGFDQSADGETEFLHEHLYG